MFNIIITIIEKYLKDRICREFFFWFCFFNEEKQLSFSLKPFFFFLFKPTHFPRSLSAPFLLIRRNPLNVFNMQRMFVAKSSPVSSV